jgi:hypothetical protein
MPAVTNQSLEGSRLPGTNPNVFCCPLLVQAPGRSSVLPVTQEVAGSSLLLDGFRVAGATFSKMRCSADRRAGSSIEDQV